MDSLQLVNNIELCLNAKLTPLVVGQPAAGKSEIIKQIAEKRNASFIDIRLAQLEAQDLSGLVYPNEEAGTFSYLPLDMFPLKGLQPKPNRDVIILLDELTSAQPDVCVAAYRLILDRQVGAYDLHDNVYLVAAGNREIDGAVVNPLPTPLVSRMVHFELNVSVSAWLRWASESKRIDSRIIAYINYAGHMLNTFNTFESDDTMAFAAPRPWEMLSKLITPMAKVTYELTELISGVIGSKAATGFINFCEVYKSLPDYKDIITNPLKVKIPEQGNLAMATIININSRVNKTDIAIATQYVNRFPMEYQTLFYQTLVYGNKLLLVSPPVRDWVSNNSDLFNM